jgi:hypothetical protein
VADCNVATDLWAGVRTADPHLLKNTPKGALTDLGPPLLRGRVFKAKMGITRHRAWLAEHTGRVQMPYLVDPNPGVAVYESADILDTWTPPKAAEQPDCPAAELARAVPGTELPAISPGAFRGGRRELKAPVAVCWVATGLLPCCR